MILTHKIYVCCEYARLTIAQIQVARVPRLMHKLRFDYIRSVRWLALCVIHFCIPVEQPCQRASWLAFGVHLVTMCRKLCKSCRSWVVFDVLLVI